MLNAKNCRSKTKAFFAERLEGLEEWLKTHYIKLTRREYFENAPFFDSSELVRWEISISHQKLIKCSCHWASTDSGSSKQASEETEADKQHDATEIKICIHVLLLGSVCQCVIKYASLKLPHSVLYYPGHTYQYFHKAFGRYLTPPKTEYVFLTLTLTWIQLMKVDLKYLHIFQHHQNELGS